MYFKFSCNYLRQDVNNYNALYPLITLYNALNIKALSNKSVNKTLFFYNFLSKDISNFTTRHHDENPKITVINIYIYILAHTQISVFKTYKYWPYLLF